MTFYRSPLTSCTAGFSPRQCGENHLEDQPNASLLQLWKSWVFTTWFLIWRWTVTVGNRVTCTWQTKRSNTYPRGEFLGRIFLRKVDISFAWMRDGAMFTFPAPHREAEVLKWLETFNIFIIWLKFLEEYCEGLGFYHWLPKRIDQESWSHLSSSGHIHIWNTVSKRRINERQITEHRITERRITKRQLTERRITEWQIIECRITEHRIIEHGKLPNVKSANVKLSNVKN